MSCTLQKILFVGFLFFVLVSACAPAEKAHERFKGYDMENPEKFIMPVSLFEISGITFHEGRNDTIFAIEDEDGKLFKLPWGIKKQTNTKFGKKGDYEDLAIVRDTVVILKSSGQLISFPLSETAFKETDTVAYQKKLLPKGEYEALYGDEATGDLYVLCKNCPGDNAKKSVSGYIISPRGAANVNAGFQINVKQIKAITGKIERDFRPSALAKNPVTNEWYIVSAVNKLLVVTDSNWAVTNAFTLNGNMFNQPEGIAFDKAGNMYISNEGDDLSEGNILKFKSNK